jgi:hypothetical protein
MAPVLQLARNCSIVIADLGVADVLSSPEWEPAQRSLDVLEVWSGVGSIHRAACLKGMEAAAFDVIHGADQDILTRQGFHNCLRQVMRLRPGGLLAMAPVCSSFTFPNMSNTKRSRLNISGDPGYPQALPPMLLLCACVCMCAFLCTKLTILRTSLVALYVPQFCPLSVR